MLACSEYFEKKGVELGNFRDMWNFMVDKRPEFYYEANNINNQLDATITVY